VLLGDVAAALRAGEAALALAQRRGDELAAGMAWFEIGFVRWVMDDLEKAQAAWQETMAHQGKAADTGAAVDARMFIGEVKLSLGDAAEAERIERDAEAAALATESEPLARAVSAVQGLDLLVTIARVRRDASALERILADGTRMGYPAITLHARLGLAEVDAAAGRATAARARLASLERDADAAGWKLFVRWARKVATRL